MVHLPSEKSSGEISNNNVRELEAERTEERAELCQLSFGRNCSVAPYE